MSNGNGILLDIGEGTTGQLLRSWKSSFMSNNTHSNNNNTSYSELWNKLSTITAIWISHPHADHHLGIIRFLSERNAWIDYQLSSFSSSFDDQSTYYHPVIIMAPSNIFQFLQEYSTVNPFIKNGYIPLNCHDMIYTQSNPLISTLYHTLNITYCASVPVNHCSHSYGLVLDSTPFGRVVYSGDCRPSNQLVNVGKNANILIHEATFDNGMEAEAVLKLHSTVGEAIEIGRQMNAKVIILTHFSQRYPKLPPIVYAKNEQNYNKKSSKSSQHVSDRSRIDEPMIAFAFDFMTVLPNNLKLAELSIPAIRLLYQDEQDSFLINK